MRTIKELIEQKMGFDMSKTFPDFKRVKKELDRNIKRGANTENFMILANVFGTKEQVKRTKEIFKKVNKNRNTLNPIDPTTIDPKDLEWLKKTIGVLNKKLPR